MRIEHAHEMVEGIGVTSGSQVCDATRKLRLSENDQKAQGRQRFGRLGVEDSCDEFPGRRGSYFVNPIAFDAIMVRLVPER
jgi:hypothetical protein